MRQVKCCLGSVGWAFGLWLLLLSNPGFARFEAEPESRWLEFAVGGIAAVRGDRHTESVFLAYSPFLPLPGGALRPELGLSVLKSSLDDLFLSTTLALYYEIELAREGLIVAAGPGFVSWTSGDGSGLTMGAGLSYPLGLIAFERISAQYDRYFFGKGVNAFRLGVQLSF